MSWSHVVLESGKRALTNNFFVIVGLIIKLMVSGCACVPHSRISINIFKNNDLVSAFVLVAKIFSS